MGSVRVAIVGVGNCASSLVQGVEYYRNADPNDRVPGLMHVTFGDYHVSDVEFVAAFDVDAKKVGMDLAEAIVASENNTIKLCDVPPTGVTVQRGPTFDGLGQYYREIVEESDAEPVDVVAGAARRAGRRGRLLPAGRLRAGRQVLRPGRDRRRLRVRQRAAGLHRLRPGVGAEVHRRRPADRRRRHQEPGRRDDRAPRAGQAVRGPRRRAAAHVPAQLRRQHGLHEHAGAQPPGLEEDLEDPVGDLPDPARDGQERRAHRPVGPRAVARRPQVGLHPAGGPLLRRHPAERRAQARGVGLAELGRRHHRRGPRREDRHGPRHRRPDPLGVVATS